MWHAHYLHPAAQPELQVVSDEYVAAVQAAEVLSYQCKVAPDMSRCLICAPCVGEAHHDFTFHLTHV